MPKKSRFTTFVVAVVFATSSCSFLRATPPAPLTNLLITSEVLQALFEIQREYSVETVKCLTGFVNAREGAVYVTSLEPTWINEATFDYANFRACDQPDVVGWAHNHIGFEGFNGERIDVCTFSPLDIKTHFSLALPMSLIVCNSRTIVWMFQGSRRPFVWIGTVPEPERSATLR